MSTDGNVRGPWNEGQGPWREGEEWTYIEDPIGHVQETAGLKEQEITGSTDTPKAVEKKEEQLSKMRSEEVSSATPSTSPLSWSYEMGGGLLSGAGATAKSSGKSKSSKTPTRS
jgi:Mn-containing catalase